jgi:signal transduction histidine kinase
MELFVSSTDAALISTCQEVLWDLEAARNEASRPLRGEPGAKEAARICVWDFEPDGQDQDFPEPEDGEFAQRIFYVVPAAHVGELRSRIPDAEGNILLKPVTRAVLRAFLGSTTGATLPPADGGDIGTLRANRDEMLQHLLHANLRLQEYDQQRTNFIARAVHDFRAPLSALSGFCGLLAGEELGPLMDEQKGVLQRMQRSIQRLSHMASAMFELSAGPRVGRNTDLQDADILEPIRQALHEIAPRTREKHVQVRADRIEPPGAPLSFEASQIEQVLVNLLDNACKFVPKYGLIEVAAYPYFWERRFLASTVSRERRAKTSRTPNAYRIDIQDSGPGVPPELREHIFEEYTSYSGSRDRSGAGLGLAICRLIISRHQGHVWVEANSEGSIFSLVLPLRRADSGTPKRAGKKRIPRAKAGDQRS